MNSSTIGSALIALAAGLIGAGSVALVQSLDESTVPAEGAVTAQQLGSLQRQLTDVVAGQDELLSRLSRLELESLAGRNEVSHAAPLLGSPDSVAALQEQLARLNEAVDTLHDRGGPGMFTISEVGTALAEIRAQEDADREAQREAMRAQRLAERLAAVSEELGLDSYQQQQLGDAATQASEALSETMQAARESGDWASMRSTMETARSAFDGQTALFLSADQQASFDELGGLRSLSGFGGGPGGFGRGRGGNR